MMERTGFVDCLRQLALVAVIVVIARLSWEHAAPFCEELLGGVWEWFRPIAATTIHVWQGGGFWTRLQLAAVIAIILWMLWAVGSAIWHWREWVPEIFVALCDGIAACAVWMHSQMFRRHAEVDTSGKKGND